MNKINNNFTHIPVLLTQVINALNIKPNGIYVDCTAGRGGHSQEILKRLDDNGKLICIDTDLDAIAFLENLFKDDKRIIVVKENFKNIKDILNKLRISAIDGALIDLGLSSPMIDDYERGFSYHSNHKLDMRMDQTQKLNAWFIVNKYDAKELIDVFKKYGEVHDQNKVVKKILEYRKTKEINTTDELVDIIKSALPKKILIKKHPAKQYFQAIRIEVNNELNNLKKVLNDLPPFLKKDGRLVIISFHSLEDRIVKQAFNKLTTSQIPKEIPIMDENILFSLLNKKPIEADEKEIANNNRSHSAKLRTLIKN